MKSAVMILGAMILYLAATSVGQEAPSNPQARGHQSAASSTKAEASVYAPYEFLIGEWDVGPEGAPAVAITSFRWGPGRSYIWFATSLMEKGVEVPHFEGLLMWNGVRKNLDMLVALDLEGGRSQEQGDFSIEPDGTVVRRITAYFSEGLPTRDGKIVGPGGAEGHFRQTFKSQDPNTMITTVMRETPKGWVASFPGSDKLLMKRRASKTSG